MKEQIEEIKKVLENTCDEMECNHPTNCDLCQATRLYNAGYRKQNEGEWKEDFDGDYYCPFCAHYPKEINHYCPNCGAKMKGGAE